jgi:hypothetical protein
MGVEIKIDGSTLVNMQVDLDVFAKLMNGAIPTTSVSRSSPITVPQAHDLLSRIDGKSVQFLKQIAANNGEIGWGEMQRIFGINDVWSEFSSSYGKGITRALRHLLGDKSARLVWWDDADWPDSDQPGTWDDCKVFVDGVALKSLREAISVA